MADILLSALVSSMVGNLNTSALKELGIAFGLRDELDNLESTLSTIQAVLQDAEEKQWKSKAISDWLRKLKEGAYDADDVLDEFATEALIQEAEKEKGVKSQVSSFFSLQNRLIFRIKMAHKLKNVRDRLESISMERSKFHLREGDINMEVFDIERRQTGSLVNESEIYGRDEEKEIIIQVLLTDVSGQDNLAIYAVWGMGGLGKTTLAQLIYNDARVEKHYDMRIWVCVSDDFHVRKLVGAIIESIDGSPCNLSELDSLQQCLQGKLRGRKFLLVLDDVWDEYHEEWNGLKDVLRCGSNGSKVIVTTRIEDVALMMNTLPIHHIGCLSENDSWSLFTRCAFGRGRLKERSELESIGKEIVKKCGGVPLAIKTLGSLMSLKSTESEWLSVKESQIWELPEGENSILSALRLSYHYLAPHLRQCFAFCCVFPKDHKLNRDKLIQLWMANGFIPFKESLEPHDVGIIIFNELVRRSFFQDVVEDSPINIICKMHDLMHDLAQSIMKLECVVVEPGKLVKVQKMTRHLYFTRGTSCDVEVCKGRSLRSCIALSTYYNLEYKSPQSIFLKQKYLRVCDLTRQPSENAARSITSLKHLRYLDMSSSYFKVLPESITCLLNLQTLKLDYCQSLHKLPNGMRHMKNLIYLGLSGCGSLTCMPEGMGQLTRLQSLSIFIVGKENGYQISELKGLHLRNELSIKELDNVRNFAEAKNANLIGKQNLHSLSLVWQNKSQCPVPEQVEDVLDGLQPHSNLKVLHIHNYLGSKFPTWMQDLLLRDLVEISLMKCERCEHLPPLDKLSFLKVLVISGMDSVKYLGNELHGDSASSFPSLEKLHLENMANLEEWRTMDGRENFPRLSTLTFRGCPKLVKMPIRASSFPSLKILYLYMMTNLEEWRTMDGRENFPRLSSLKIWRCPKLVEMPIIPSITSLSIRKSNAMLIKSVMNLTSLSFLKIESMHESTLLPDGLFQNLTAMKRFELDDCNGLESLPEGLHLHSLRELDIRGCTNILSFPVNGLRGLSSLQRLWIQSCDKFCSLSEGIQYLTSLEDLIINRCPELVSLPKQIGCLTSLSSLQIWHCDKLMSLPDELQNLTALKTLSIYSCPHLQRRCKKDSGEDWHKIARIPNIHIDEDDPPPVQSRNGCKALQKLKFWST
ncbi:putative disease resistance protein RGA3 [Quercus robur]|uniref:putative disease resistance protein RGA3 n=1 Tax=Quercus robur TaxID=38942 RepID=UPI002161BE75|nr:putative disease resistance protein RGA3 [Quercus robur]